MAYTPHCLPRGAGQRAADLVGAHGGGAVGCKVLWDVEPGLEGVCWLSCKCRFWCLWLLDLLLLLGLVGVACCLVPIGR